MRRAELARRRPPGAAARAAAAADGDPHDAARRRRDRRRRAADPVGAAAPAEPPARRARRPAPGAPAVAEQLPLGELPTRRRVSCAAPAASPTSWPFSHGPCLRRALVGGHLLRDLDPAVRLGVTGTGDELLAHAWLEIDGRPLEPSSSYVRVRAAADGGRAMSVTARSTSSAGCACAPSPARPAASRPATAGTSTSGGAPTSTTRPTPPPGEVIAEYVDRPTSAWYTATDDGRRLPAALPRLRRVRDLGRPGRGRRAARSRPAATSCCRSSSPARPARVLLTLRGTTVLHASAVADRRRGARVRRAVRARQVDGRRADVPRRRRARHRRRADGRPRPAGDVHRRGLRAAPARGGGPPRRRPARTGPATRRPTTAGRSPRRRRRPARCRSAAIVIPSPSRTATRGRGHAPAAERRDVRRDGVPPGPRLAPADVLTREFTTLSRLVNEIPVYDVTIPWGPPFSPDVAPAARRPRGAS